MFMQDGSFIATVNLYFSSFECLIISFDLIHCRFIPDDMEFDHEPSSTATSLPVEGTYKPSIFVNTALHQSNVCFHDIFIFSNEKI